MGLSVHINTDSQDLPLNTSAVDYTEFSEGNDKLIFTAGNSDVQDGQDSPSQQELISAGVILTGSEIEIDTYLLDDVGANQIKSINGMGNLDKRYVLAFDFDASTASEPVLEVWDDSSLDTIDTVVLGSGTASSSFVRGVTTTDASPGANWFSTADKLAGSGDGHFLYLNNQNGALTTAKTLYANIGIVIPASQTNGASLTPVFVVKWLES